MSKTKLVSTVSAVLAGPVRMAAYRVRDPVTDKLSDIQFHMTYANMVVAVMGEDSAKLFARFVTETLSPDGLPAGSDG